MLRIIVASLLLAVGGGTAHAADDVKQCQARQLEIAKKADAFTGDPMMKKLIEADLRRATRELIEGDADECMEALDHATKLLNDKV